MKEGSRRTILLVLIRLSTDVTAEALILFDVVVDVFIRLHLVAQSS